VKDSKGVKNLKTKNKYSIIALIGKSASGKDSLLHQIVAENPNLNKIVNYTSRPQREGEIDGVDYRFVNKSEIYDLIFGHRMLLYTWFNHWFYGTPISTLSRDKINIGIFNPAGIQELYEDEDVDLQVYYITASDKTRLLRQLDREENPDIKEIIRRWQTDDEDFADLPFEYTEISNDGTIEEALTQLRDKML
jgi:guanylate kinase